MPQTISEYKLVHESSDVNLNTLIAPMIKDGWQPFESPIVTGSFVFQAMVRYKKLKKKKK